ncbi:phosphoribosylglycinamide formyltransferase [Algicella marina]|uniref:Phosphoribosylglycinamide formyltransferase n=1 Tax=Algicella marina TaxID=2683284 RepID=A0A6P1SWU0_9RHOB|nr:phosphoribosylglycinamide formyltransferase [Algicella marina]QHQ34908.1 phosphoribosylglycinamide formyltransferase [Algicella marina]
MKRKRVAILISGSGSNMVKLVESMADSGHPGEAVLVLANKAEAGGLTKAEALGVPVAVVAHKGKTREEFEAEVSAVLEAAEVDIVCLAGFMRVLSAAFVREWQGRILNIHPSLLPLFKGLDTHQRALDAGMAVHGATVHQVTADLDAGPILGQAVMPVHEDDTAETLAARLLPLEHRLYPEVLARFAAGSRGRVALFA